MALTALLVVMLLSSPVAFAAKYTVDWKLNSDYSSWATKSVNVGDTIEFTYDSSHSADVVSESDYKSCDASNALQPNSKSPTTITLKEGTTYIICGTPGHCSPSGGMKLQVTAKAASGSGGSTTPTPAGGSPATPSSGTTPPSPTPSGVAGALSGAHLSFGLGLGAVVALLA